MNEALFSVFSQHPCYLFTPGEPQPLDCPKLLKVRFELRFKQPQWQVPHINHSRGQRDPLGNKKENIQ